MEVMDTKQYLMQISRLDKMIQNKLSEICQLKTMACSVTTYNDGERVQTSSDKDRLGTIVSKIVDMERNVDEMIDTRCKIVNQIDGISDLECYDMLAKMYILGKNLKVIAVERGVTYRYMVSIHKKAIKAFEEKYGSEYLG